MCVFIKYRVVLPSLVITYSTIFQYTTSENQIHLQCEEVKASTKRNGKYYFIGFIQKLI